MLIRAALVPPREAVEELWSASRVLRSLPGIDAVPPARLDIPITAFGNLVPEDCARLAAKLRSVVEGAEAPVVWFQGLRLEVDGTIALGLAGDVEPLADLARFVSELAETMRLYVDRRRFRPQIALATAATESSGTLLEPALRGLAGWTGEPWPVSGLTLLRTRWRDGNGTPEIYDVIRLDPSFEPSAHR